MENKYEFQIKYYRKLLEEDFVQYFRFLNKNKIPYNLDIFNKEVEECMKEIEKITKKLLTKYN